MSMVADAVERHQASLALADRSAIIITRLQNDLETSQERHKEEATLTTKAEAETVR